MINSVFWTDAVATCRERGKPWVMATVIYKTGSAPRDNGTKMLITDENTYDSVGGGRLEFLVIQRARELLLENREQQLLENFHLAAKTQQCCGGGVSILFECFKSQAMQLHVFGAGHVAKALMKIVGEIDACVTWVDSRAEQFPEALPETLSKPLPSSVTARVIANPVDHVSDMPAGAYALIVTHDHALDYALVEALLERKDCAYIGLIGSDTKARRFRKRLAHAAYSAQEIEQVICPVGLSSIPGKRPMEVAVSIAGQLIQLSHQQAEVSQSHKTKTEKTKGVPWQTMQELLPSNETAPQPGIKKTVEKTHDT